MLKKLNIKSEFLKSVVVLMTGTVFAQVLNMVMLPVLTRYFYDAEEFGEFNLYMRLVGFVSGIAAARFEMSLPLPKYDGHSFLLYRLALRIATYSMAGMAFAGFLYFIFQPDTVFDLPFLLVSLVSTFFVVFINLGTMWSVRNKAFEAISRQKIVSAVSANGLRVLFALMSMGGIGLSLATMIGYIISSVWYIEDYYVLDKKLFPKYSKKKNKVLLKEYREFPLVNLPHTSVDLGRELLVAMFVSMHFGLEVFGLFSVSHTILKLPLSFIGVSIGQVFYSRATELANSNQSIYPLLRKTFLGLFALSVVPFGVVFFFGEYIFEFVLGQDFALSGYYSEIMATWLMMVFLVSPISSLSLVLRRQKEYFVLGIINSTIQLLGFGVLPLILGKTEAAWQTTLWILTVAMTIYFICVAFISIYYTRKGVKA